VKREEAYRIEQFFADQGASSFSQEPFDLTGVSEHMTIGITDPSLDEEMREDTRANRAITFEAILDARFLVEPEFRVRRFEEAEMELGAVTLDGQDDLGIKSDPDDGCPEWQAHELGRRMVENRGG
jgi:hypothetical protein